MDYNKLLDLTTELGYRLAMSGAETYRIEESVNRIMAAYSISAEAFAIPNCLHVSIETENSEPMTRMRRIGYHGNDLDAVEKYSNLSRRICTERPDPKIAMQWLEETEQSRIHHALWAYLPGAFMGGCGFAVLFNGGLIECIVAGLCGVLIGLVNKTMARFKANPFFSTIAASFIMTLFAYLANQICGHLHTESIIIGALMILVPGLLFTNAIRDIIYGDTNSGINRIVQVLLTAAAIALGTGAAWKLADVLWGVKDLGNQIAHSLWIEALAAFVGCVGFTFLFNIHGNGKYLCAIGGVLTWLAYRISFMLLNDMLIAYFIGTAIASVYAEIMARVRKYPAISYLVISAFPLIPGAGVYNAVKYAMRGDLSAATDKGMETLAIAGVMAVGILLVSTAVRIISIQPWKKRSE